MLKIVFFGSSNFGIPSLKKLSQKCDVLSVFTNHPKPAGRGKMLSRTSVDLEAEKLGLKIIHSTKPLVSDLPEDFDIGIVVAYGSIISKSVLESAKYGFLNIHPSDLPKFRGAAPIERTIESGEESTRICVIKMTPRLDDGDILSSVHYKINKDETSLDLQHKFAIIGSDILFDAINKLHLGAQGERQNHELATYAKKISNEELELKAESLTAVQALNKVRAFAFVGHPFIFYEGRRIKIIKAEISSIQKTKIDLRCVDGILSPTVIKVEGKRETENYFSL